MVILCLKGLKWNTGFLFLDAPVFTVASNSTLNHFIKTGKNGSLNCSVALSNPPMKNIKFSNNSKYTKNIKVHNMCIHVCEYTLFFVTAQPILLTTIIILVNWYWNRFHRFQYFWYVTFNLLYLWANNIANLMNLCT